MTNLETGEEIRFCWKTVAVRLLATSASTLAFLKAAAYVVAALAS